MSAYPPPPSGVTGAPTVLPDYSIGFADAVKRGFKHYVTFDGRAGRAEFWYWYLFVVGVLLVLFVPAAAIGTATASGDGSAPPIFVAGLVAAGLFYAAVILPTIAIACRRLHDAGFSGLYLLLGLITGLIPLIMCVLPTSPNAVRYGPPGQPAPYGLPPGGYGHAPGSGPPQVYGGSPAPQAYGAQPARLDDGQTYEQPPGEPRRG